MRGLICLRSPVDGESAAGIGTSGTPFSRAGRGLCCVCRHQLT